jgi:hypothetical protein
MEPKITYYARVLDNITNEQVLGFTDLTKSSTWYYGKCDGLNGGESEYVVEFDIWNNEAELANTGGYVDCGDATNCRLTVWADKNRTIQSPLFNLSNPFMYARCTSFNYNEPFKGIKGQTSVLDSITGNMNRTSIDSRGFILGKGDHALVQTKIILPKDSQLETQRYSFVFEFMYDYE